jgi:outer membrane protein assembly factor BamA
LVFSAYQKAGYDIFLVESAAALLADSSDLAIEDFYPFRQVGQQPLPGTPTLMVYGTGGDTGMEHFDFTTIRSSREKQTTDDTLRYLDAHQQYLRHPYKVRFSVDAMQAQAVYSQYFGVQGASELLFSDLLGNHRIHLSLDLYGKIKLTNYSLYYQYLARRPELQLGIHRRIYYFATSQDTIFRDNYFGGLVQLNFPVNRYLRVELQQRLTGVDRSFTTGELDADQYYVYHALELDRFLVPQLRLVYDNVIWGSTGPENGFRGYVGARWSFPFSFPGAGRNFGVNFQTLTFDLRRYLRLSRDYQFALRLGGGFSLGDSPQRFFLGGESNWINYRLAPVGRDRARILTSMDRIYLSEFVFPVRGSRYYERIGDSYALGNLEFRFPLLHYLLLGWPTQLGFSNVRGALFLDLGSAWYGRDFHGLRRTEEGRLVLDDLLLGYGWGARFHLGYFLIKMDAAWRSDLDGSPGKPFYSFSLGAEL